MKTFIKWTIRASALFGSLFLILYVTDQVKISPWQSFLVFLIGSVSLGAFFYLIEDHYLPIRRRQVLNKVLRVFEAEALSESQAQFKTDGFDVMVDIDFILSLNTYAANGEVVAFHVPLSQWKAGRLGRPLSQIEDQFNGVPTYRIYQTNGMGLKLAKRRIEQGLR